MRQSSLVLALGVVFASPAYAETLPEFVGETIVVTPTRFGDLASDRAVNVTVITRKDIERNPAITLPEILQDYAGIGMRDLFGNNASNSTVDMRGFGAAAGQNTLVLVDGVRQNDIDLSGVVWSAIPLSAIERIEIVRGGNSVMHGAGAVGGVINIITRSPAGRSDEATVSARYGSFNTRNLQATGNLAGNNMGLTLAASDDRSDGWRDNNENRQNSFYGNARWKLEGGEIGLKLGADTQDLRLPGARLVEPDQNQNQLASDPKGAQTPRDWASRDGWQAVLSGQFRLPKGELAADLDYRNKDQEAYFYQGGYPTYRRTTLDMWTFSPRVKLPLQTGGLDHELILGVDQALWNYHLAVSNDPANIGQPINRVQADQRNSALYAQDHLRLSESLSVTAGARMEWFHIKASDSFDPAAPGAAYGTGAPAGEQSERESAWDLGMRYRAAPGQTLYAKASRSFRFATVDEIYEYSPTYSRQFQFLKPQTSLDQELGWEFGTARHGGRLALYHDRVEDEIHLDPYGAGIGNTNLPPLRRYGMELEGRSSVGAVDFSAAYTLAFSKFTSGVFNGVPLKGKNVPLVPRNKLSLNATWNISAMTRLTGSANYVTDQYMDNDETNTLGVKIPAYTVADIRVEHRVGNWKVAAAINNVLDEKYYTYAVRSQFDVYDSAADRYAAYPLPGRHGWVSAEYRFK